MDDAGAFHAADAAQFSLTMMHDSVGDGSVLVTSAWMDDQLGWFIDHE